jgi:hypothetical protein
MIPYKDPESLKKWTPVAYLLLLSSVLGALLALAGFGLKAYHYFFPEDVYFSGAVNVSVGTVIEDHDRLAKLLVDHLGESIEISALVTYAQLEASPACRRKGMDWFEFLTSDVWEGAFFPNTISGDMLIPFMSRNCVGTILVVSEDDMQLIDGGTFFADYRIQGKFVVTRWFGSGENGYKLVAD